MSDNNVKVLQELVQIANDSARFYDDARQEVKNPSLQNLFGRMAQAKRNLIGALGNRITLAGEEVPDRGTIAGSLHKAYTDIRASLSSREEAVYVGQLEEAEDRLLAHFTEALETLDDRVMRDTVLAQMPQVRACHDEMRQMKQRLAA